MKKDIKQSKALRAFQKFGFEQVRVTNHIILKNAEGVSISVPTHRVLKGSTLINCCKAGGIDKVAFFKLV